MVDRNREEWNLAQHIIDRVCGRASGRSSDVCLRNCPRDVYFIGNLRPRPETEDSEGFLAELISKLAPTAFGCEFTLDADETAEVIVDVKLSWSCYYRVFPSYDEQLRHQRRAAEPVNRALEESEPESGSDRTQSQEEDSDLDEQRIEEEDPRETDGSPADRRRTRNAQDAMLIKFRKISCRAEGKVVIKYREDGRQWLVDVAELDSNLNREMDACWRKALSDPDRFRARDRVDYYIKLPEDALESKSRYEAFTGSLSKEVIPKWNWDMAAEVRPSGDAPRNLIVSFEFVNSSPPIESPNIEPFLFDCTATFGFEKAKILPFILDIAPKGFRYNRKLWARGFNCGIEKTALGSFQTTHTPIHLQLRYVTREEPEASFEDLSRDPMPVLQAIQEAMEAYLQDWDSRRRAYASGDPEWESNFGTEFDRDRTLFVEEIRRFRKGLNLIRKDADVLSAFKLTNEVFFRLGRASSRPKDRWRLFQIVFIVTQIPGIVALRDSTGDQSDREMVDIIYFATGGGKTEAYLGVIGFHCFFDRLRGKAAGVTAWTRFPLRLLTLQQTQRMADVISMAELIRAEQTDKRLVSPDVDGFAVGYFVGGEATPNEILNAESYRYAKSADHVTWSAANDPVVRQKWKRVVRCPGCGTDTVNVDFDPVKIRLIHRCTNQDCAFTSGEIPVFVVDNEVYRYLPCVVVGTIDKLANIGHQRKLAQVFGNVDGRCDAHGYYSGKCCQKDCYNGKLDTSKPRGLSGPTLFLQDELHLLKEGLGTFDAHYETFSQRLIREFGQEQALKIIASTATIEKFERQVEHLYGRKPEQARIFPGIGPTLEESFYATTLRFPQRVFVGIIPHNKTIFNTILEVLEFFHREVLGLWRLQPGEPNPYGGEQEVGTPEWREMLDPYLTSLTYFLANRQLDEIHTDIKGDVNGNLIRDGLPPIEIHQLTGGVSTDDVATTLAKLETNASGEAADAVLATSMVSHGVDVDRLNAMIFYGMPRQNAEYIQASSRVGRAHVGIVFTCLHPARERDQSHYTYFTKFHEFLGQLVEPVAINRWATYSVNRTLPGLFMGVLLQLVANRSKQSNPNSFYFLDFLRKKIDDGTLAPESFVDFLQDSYLISKGGSEAELSFREVVRKRVPEFFDQIIGAGPDKKFASEALMPRPMTSLRDIDEPVPIELDMTGRQWLARSRK